MMKLKSVTLGFREYQVTLILIRLPQVFLKKITYKGSPRYMSPEVLLYNTPANPSMDVWALAVILFKMLHR